MNKPHHPTPCRGLFAGWLALAVLVGYSLSWDVVSGWMCFAFVKNLEEITRMTLVVTILATITAVVMLITKLIELQLAQAKSKELDATINSNKKIDGISHHNSALLKTVKGLIIPSILIFVIVLCFWTDLVLTKTGLAIVVFCSISTPFYALIPLIARIVDNLSRLTDVTKLHLKITDTITGTDVQE